MEGWPRRLGWGLRLPLVENLPGPLDVGQQGRLADGGESGEVDHPGQEQVIEIGIDPSKGGGADPRADQGEVDVGGGALTAEGAGAVENRLLHFGVGGEHLLDGGDGRLR